MKKWLKITGIIILALLIIGGLLVSTPFLFKERFTRVVKQTVNATLTAKLDFSEMTISFFRHFPHLTLNLKEFSLMSSPPFVRDTLVYARDISFGINLLSLFRDPVEITRIYIHQGKVLIQYTDEGTSNFEVYQTSSETKETVDTASSGNTAFKINYIDFIQTDITYSDPSIPLKMVAHGINYQGKSDLVTHEILRLTSRVQIDSFDLFFNHTPYIQSKPVKADLTTSINMSSLEMKFDKNNLFIKDIPFEFRGELSFRNNGYSLFIALFSMFHEEYLSGSLWMVNTNTLWLSAKTDIQVTLENWAKGFGVRDMDLRGKLSIKLKLQGEYATGQNPENKRPDTVLLSIPDFTFTSKLTGGYFRLTKLPEAISGISFDLDVSSTDHDYRTILVKLDNLKAKFLQNHLEGYLRVDGLADLPIESRLSSQINLAELRQVIPFDSLEMKGILDVSLDINGRFAPEKKLFPQAALTLNLNNGSLQTKYYPKPIEEITVSASVFNETGTLSGTRIRLNPVSFSFEGNPFTLRADIANPGNISYSITSKGVIDLARIYHLFSPEGMDLAGYIYTDLNLKGRQSDAMAGHYERLHNSGKLLLRNIAVTSEYLPKPLIIQSGVFRFRNDSISFEKFETHYGNSDIRMKGYLNNVVNYALAENQVLSGNFSFLSDNLILDEFISENELTDSGKDTIVPGVIQIPDDLEIGLKANIGKIRFHDLDIRDLTCLIEVKRGFVLLKTMDFELIGCSVNMEATYGAINQNRAFFDFHIQANDFNIRRAYQEVELFRNLTTSAGKCEGIVSLNYTLSGKLGGGMNPIYPSLNGGGTLSLEKVTVKGLKLFTTLGKNLEKERIKNPDLSKVEIRSTIKNNVITVERTRLKIAGFRFRIEGETNFDGQLNLKTRLGLPPLGIVGIPIRVLGTQEDLKFKYGRGLLDESVEETEYLDELPPELLGKIKNAKEEDLPDNGNR